MPNASIEQQYEELARLWKEMTAAESRYYQLRYAAFQTISSLKKQSELGIPYKHFERAVRRDAKKRIRQGYYGKRPKGKQLDHFYIPVLLAYILGIDNLDIINSKLNCKWMNAKTNRKKGVCTADESYSEFSFDEYSALQSMIRKWRYG